MDLRNKDLSYSQLVRLHSFIVDKKLGYQPFIFTESLEVGEGLRFQYGETNGGNIYWENADPKVQDLLVDDLQLFRECNQNLRKIYDYIVNSVVKNLGGDISQLTFAEIGCNTGYFLHSLALLGAKHCTGYDFTNNGEVFHWFNNVLGIDNDFQFAEWDSLKHSLNYAEMLEVDVALSVNVTCHLADPIHHLCYLCDHSRKAIFIYSPVNNDSDYSIHFGTPAKYLNSLDYPISFDNEIRLSVPLIKLTLEEAGFSEIIEIDCPEDLPDAWRSWFYSQRAFMAFRTQDKKTALSLDEDGRRRRFLPGDVSFLLKEDVDPLDKLQSEFWELQDQIKAMESSKFWKLRQKWMTLKKSIKSSLLSCQRLCSKRAFAK